MLLYEGELVWKGYMEYNPRGMIHGTPYYIITQERTRDHTGKYQLLAYDIEQEQYVLLEEGTDYTSLSDKATKLNDVKHEERRRELYGDAYESMFGKDAPPLSPYPWNR